jgi:hypothetical protein
MSRALAAVQRLAIGEDLLGSDDDAHLTALRLIGVRKGSAVFPCVSEIPDRTVSNLRLVGHVIEDPETADRISYGFSPLRDLAAVAKQLHCEIIIQTPGREGSVLATIQPDSYERIAKSLLIQGETLLTGRVERAGGTTEEKCALRLSTQPRLLYCSIESTDSQLVRKLGQRLYEDVAVSGLATWIRGTWRIISFKIRELHEQRHARSSELAKRLKKVAGRGWGVVEDPDAYLREVTGEG